MSTEMTRGWFRPTNPICIMFGHSFSSGYCITCGRRIGG